MRQACAHQAGHAMTAGGVEHADGLCTGLQTTKLTPVCDRVLQQALLALVTRACASSCVSARKQNHAALQSVCTSLTWKMLSPPVSISRNQQAGQLPNDEVRRLNCSMARPACLSGHTCASTPTGDALLHKHSQSTWGPPDYQSADSLQQGPEHSLKVEAHLRVEGCPGNPVGVALTHHDALAGRQVPHAPGSVVPCRHLQAPACHMQVRIGSRLPAGETVSFADYVILQAAT